MTPDTDVAALWNPLDHWIAGARVLFEEVAADLGDLDAVRASELYQAAELVSTADELDEVAREQGRTATGSAGQPVVAPWVVESRLARTTAAKILATLRPQYGASDKSAAARSMARARWGRGGGL